MNKFVDLNDKILNEPLPLFDFNNPHVNAKELVLMMSAELAETKYGVGLSANQLNLPHRVFIMRINVDENGEKLDKDGFIACFNPVITYVGEEVMMHEGCLSAPDLFVKIKRPGFIRVKYQDENGNVVTSKFSGLTCRVFQHELDHLNGINFLTRANKYHLQQAKNQLKLVKRKKKRFTNLGFGVI